MMLRYFRYARTRLSEKGLAAFGLGDWCDPNEEQNGGIASPLEFTDSAELYDIGRKAAEMCAAVGLTAESAEAAQFAADMRAAIRTHLIDRETLTVAGDCQTSQAVALGMGLFDEAELPAARKKLLEIIHRDGDINACGMIGLRYIYHALADMGEIDLACRMILDTGRTGYGCWLAQGATTLFEMWLDPQGETYSLNHHFYGDVSSFMIGEIAGLKIDSPAAFRLTPQFPAGLSWAEAHHRDLRCRWEREGTDVALTVTVPADMTGILCPPSGFACREAGQPIGAGTHRFLLTVI